MKADWDTLIILDACRYDDFSEHWDGEDVEKRYSPTSTTGEFVSRCIREKYDDTVYVTANPHLLNREEYFVDMYHVWKTHWDEELRTVHPEKVLEVAKKAHTRYPDKRIVVHFMQPHAPYIGPEARSMGLVCAGTAAARKSAQQLEYADMATIWDKISNGEVEPGTVRKLYKENLDIVLPYVKDLIKNINGKVVITADHGEAFGEMFRGEQVFGHTGAKHAPPVIKVPWVEISGSRRKISAGETHQARKIEEKEVKQQQERLEALGYR
jgi:hypothetical protein